MHSSWFSYPITRPFPFRWFTPVAIVGGLILMVLFTIINLASSAFYLKPIFTDDPNGTTTKSVRWFMKAPLNWDNNMKVKCQPKILSVGDRVFSTNLGFQYSVKALTSSDDDSGFRKTYPSIAYLNNTLEDCYLTRVDINLRKSDARASNSWWLSWITTFTDATASCNVMTSEGLVNIILGVEYTGQSDHIYDYVIEDDYKTHASTWWGTRLLNVYFTGILSTMSQTQDLGDDSYWMTGGITFTTNPNIKDIRDPKLFNLAGWFLSSDGFIQNEPLNDTSFIKTDPKFVPVVWESLHYTRILHSLIAVDLGNQNAPNLLLDKKDLQYAILPPDDPNRKNGSFLNDSSLTGQATRYAQIPTPGAPLPPTDKNLVLLNETYDRFASEMGPLESKDATIVSQYLCSVPQSKSPGIMLLAILLADLVFLQAAWVIYNWIAGSMLSESQMQTCQGCVESPVQVIEKEGLLGEGKTTVTSGSYVSVSADEGAGSNLLIREAK
ncbi:hypothetical protein FOXG_03852 [Fusarium oxysporum f. sp. lycopersici 4287]|uniref:Uncharacterized protein n=2 Tax=Fusarium oxysporum TaxID=5507 RepID=A0A0J9UMX0_FUSO4|nr:hypothetical protein FOXG_03852 [Fusarium oxysporum f. sp. lycopersici 4287]EXK44702.1 hypothetical protein FOMG_03389 [Fusarium oxysporum f. sp. melonis 26406]KNB00238.1 hypothetical protein FOXG_03852 [Fusarium oxysporum f. sp. lycopersici 4287]